MSRERSDESLVQAIQAKTGHQAAEERDILFRRYYDKVALWCLRFSGDRQVAADLAQEVFLRVHERLESFRGESRFSTWLYTVTRSVAINRGQFEKRRQTEPLDDEFFPEPKDARPSAEDRLSRDEIGTRLRRAMAEDLEPDEAKILYLHYVDGMTLPAITSLLSLNNKSGAKAYVVRAKRKLNRTFGRWLGAQNSHPRQTRQGQ